MGYMQLTQEGRYHIYGLLKGGYTRQNIALEIGVHKSTISREIKRNSGQKGYRPKQAQEMATQRKEEAPKRIKMTPELVEKIEAKIKLEWSPEQISGRLFRDEGILISHERIYQHIKEDKDNGGTLYTHLRYSGKKRKKRFGAKDRRGEIKNKISIEKRPAIVEKKSRVGDWERDLIIGKNHKGALLTVVDRTSKMTLVKRWKTSPLKMLAMPRSSF
jgi:transposase, IS30 family